MAGGGAFLLTLMACYGAPPRRCDGEDKDGDRSCLPEDCNDNDRKIRPYVDDPGQDGIDQNCDGVDGFKKVAPADSSTAPAPP